MTSTDRPQGPAAHPLDVDTTLETLGDGRFSGRASARYCNVGGSFGGFVSAIALKAALLHPARLGEPIALTVNFAGPLADGELTVRARAARTNRSTQHWMIEVAQGDVVATATAVFAVRRQTWSSTESVFPQVPPFDGVEPLPPGRSTPWMRNYDMRFIRGTASATARPEAPWDSVTTMWIRDDPPRPLDYVSLAAICDAFFPRIYVRRPDLEPFGTTVSLTTYFHVDSEMMAAHGDRELLGTARALQFRGGYCDQTAEIWTPAGELIAATHQTALFRT
ncbi:MAG TPA: thioesterase family protein [Quisquiliibacterium sp.]|nr:thioesterase family protein [Quisquiliibacterium sp.]